MNDEEVVRQFCDLWWREKKQTLYANKWLGVATLQNPFDMWMIQEIICEVRPDVIVETGSWCGGSAALWSMLLGQLNPQGLVVSIDVEDRLQPSVKALPALRQVEFLVGNATESTIVSKVATRAAEKRVLVILDSAHTKDHVLAELRAYAPFVSMGSYIVVQDTCVNGHPIEPDWGPGPFEAVIEFLASDHRFEVDRDRERMLLTCCPNGYLRRRE